MKKSLALLAIFTFIFSCSYRPILDPHGKYLEVGKAQADEDIDQCLKEADDYLDQFKAERAAKEAARKAVIGGVVGAGSGLLFGKNAKSTLTGGLIGAGVGAALGSLSVLGEDKVSPSQMKQRYAAQCLANRGYSIIGWQ